MIFRWIGSLAGAAILTVATFLAMPALLQVDSPEAGEEFHRQYAIYYPRKEREPFSWQFLPCEECAGDNFLPLVETQAFYRVLAISYERSDCDVGSLLDSLPRLHESPMASSFGVGQLAFEYRAGNNSPSAVRWTDRNDRSFLLARESEELDQELHSFGSEPNLPTQPTVRRLSFSGCPEGFQSNRIGIRCGFRFRIDLLADCLMDGQPTEDGIYYFPLVLEEYT